MTNYIYNLFIKQLDSIINNKIQTGIFGAYMVVDIVNDGPRLFDKKSFSLVSTITKLNPFDLACLIPCKSNIFSINFFDMSLPHSSQTTFNS